MAHHHQKRINKMTKTILTLSKWLIVPLLVILTGCAQKPPSCADEKTIATIKDIVVNYLLDGKTIKAIPKSEDPQNIIDKAIKGLKVEMKNVVTQGYDDKARKHACRGNMVVTEVTGNTLTLDVSYISQATEDKGGGSMVEIEGISKFLIELDGNLTLNYYKKTLRW